MAGLLPWESWWQFIGEGETGDLWCWPPWWLLGPDWCPGALTGVPPWCPWWWWWWWCWGWWGWLIPFGCPVIDGCCEWCPFCVGGCEWGEWSVELAKELVPEGGWRCCICCWFLIRAVTAAAAAWALFWASDWPKKTGGRVPATATAGVEEFEVAIIALDWAAASITWRWCWCAAAALRPTHGSLGCFIVWIMIWGAFQSMNGMRQANDGIVIDAMRVLVMVVTLVMVWMQGESSWLVMVCPTNVIPIIVVEHNEDHIICTVNFFVKKEKRKKVGKGIKVCVSCEAKSCDERRKKLSDLLTYIHKIHFKFKNKVKYSLYDCLLSALDLIHENMVLFDTLQTLLQYDTLFLQESWWQRGNYFKCSWSEKMQQKRYETMLESAVVTVKKEKKPYLWIFRDQD